MKRLLAILLFIALVTGLGACSKPSVSRDTLTYIAFAPSDSLVPLDIGLCEPNVMHAIYDGLVKMDTDGNIAPMLAKRWDDSGEKTVFYLDPNAKFHDGTPVTANDVIFSLDLFFKGTYSHGFKSRIASYEKNDDHTVTLYKTAPYVNLFTFGIENIFIIPKAAYEKDPAAFEKAPVGSGPYMFVSKDNDGMITLKAFDGYHLGKAEVENIIVKPPVDPSTAVIAIQTGEADMFMGAPISQLSVFDSNDKAKVVLEKNSWSANTLLPLSNRLAQDQNLRKAIFHGVNRINAVALANENIGDPAVNLFAKRLMGEFADKSYGPLYDEKLAKDYLSKSHYDGSPITITIWQETALAESVQSDLKKIGIDAKIEQLDGNAWFDKLEKGELELTIVPYGSFSGTLESLLISMSSTGANYGERMDKNANYDALIKQMQTETDEAKRKELIGKALEILYERADVSNLFDTPFAYIINSDFDYSSKAGAGSLCLYFGDIKLKTGAQR
ncbi:peptide ABC transporter substrate-binding protein [Brevibacillus reuszeri]|uniref:ABC transporter substrate-binding protein n=1 Tax=Brevibacillus reuszeri TaxID=54915 RepID=UPI001B1E0F1F|nr:ABC transporter substrate-binding protein [Brevibacillus reuszeri]GIO05908.1 peptide ABC transporter substrate-binding protein [Brevibacillus reuszeri]